MRKIKSIRKLIAKRNSIAYTPAVCNNEDEWKGECPVCYKETEYILKEIQKT